ncbi:LOW QUALITY PROTEIN: hypothetical protein CVT26_005063 [Gymnopilus dilepis]|uniref:NACHT domain-containing protein n=1 Tax=Gymnopilus dilepis TaxID=231916 RepID=A0A409Y0D1_9AGAR|nr:LOW QUALITY PROTEIN: hypothetical protein CVT26_005063 [Gymnopilus dilepis]
MIVRLGPYFIEPDFLTWNKVENFRKTANWISPLNFRATQIDTYSKHAPGTGRWFLESLEFKKWISGEWASTLSIVGMPGAGKTILSFFHDLEIGIQSLLTRGRSIIVAHLQRLVYDNSGTALAFAYFRHNDNHSPSDILAALIKQLFEDDFNVQQYIRPIHDDHAKKGIRPSEEEWFRILKDVLGNFNRIYIVIDALDEGSAECRSSVLRMLSDLPVSLITTSRPLDLSQPGFKHTLEIDMDDHTKQDIESFSIHSLETNHRIQRIINGNSAVQAEILAKLKEKSHGMFLAVSLHVQVLSQCKTENELRQEADSLPSDLNNMYAVAMEWIETQGEGEASTAKRALLWITNACRSLDIEELQHAVAISLDKPGFNDGDVTPADLLVAWCCGLITVDKESNEVCLAHYTTYDFLKNITHSPFPRPHFLLAASCIAYLEAFDFHVLLADAYASWDGPFILSLPDQFFYRGSLLRYAYDFWGHHARLSQTEAALPACVADFVSNIPGYLIGRDGRDHGSPCHVAAFFGLLDVLCVTRGFHRKRTVRGWTTLMLASHNGHYDVVKFLLSQPNVDVNAVNTEGRTALHLATITGREAVVELLLSHEMIDPYIMDKADKTPLMIVCTHSHGGNIMHLLLRKTVLHLLFNSKFGDNPDMLCHTEFGRNLELLLSHPGIDVNAEDTDGRTILHLFCSQRSRNACSGACESSIRPFLADPRLDINARDNEQNTVLHLLCNQDHIQHCKNQVLESILHLPTINVNARNDNLMSALDILRLRGEFENADLLLSHPAIHPGYTALRTIWAYDLGNHAKALAKSLILHDRLDINKAFHLIFERPWQPNSNSEEIALSLLCRTGFDINSKDECGRTVLHLICSWRPLRSIRNLDRIFWLLFCDEIEVDIRDRFGRTALQLAFENHFWQAIPLLVKHSILGIDKQSFCHLDLVD